MEYLERVKKYRRDIYILGKKVEKEKFFEHPNIKPTIKAIAKTYEVGKKYYVDNINLLNKEIKNSDELIKRYEYQRELSLRLATCNYRCTGCDAINSLSPATKALDEKLGTDYHSRFRKLLREIQKDDLACTAALTDPKGERGKRPVEQPEMFLRVVERKTGGVVVSGAKVHQSGAFAADVNFFMPTPYFLVLEKHKALTKDEEPFAVAFAILPEDKGVKYVLQNTGIQAKQREGGRFEYGNPYGDRTTCMIILDNVFVPEDRVFGIEDVDVMRETLSNFAVSHRCVSAACKAGFLDGIAGAASLMIKANSLSDVPTVQQKLLEIIAAAELSFSAAIGAAVKGFDAKGVWMPNPLTANAAKFYGVEMFNKAILNLIDISGGIVGTSISEFDLKGEIGDKVGKYLRTTINAEERLKLVKFIEYWLMSSHLVGAVHGGGAPTAALTLLKYLTNIKEKENIIKDLLCLEILE
ncbi:MAG: 4-hydroxyphenylacetate 3-hydroxylase N-terminal domain-containing protein [Archaeoglobaceae archaeon]